MQASEDQISYSKVAELLRSFREAHRALYQLLRVEADALHLTPVQLMVLRVLHEESELSLGDVAARLQLSCSTMSGVIKRLVKADMLQRERLESDQRTVAIRLTAKGQAMQAQAFGDGSRITQQVSKIVQLSGGNVDRLIALHQQLVETLRMEGEYIRDEV